jgi:type VI secretion system protein ImpA
MSQVWDSRPLREPIEGASPCGVELEPDALLLLDGYRVFGRSIPLDAPLEKGEHGRVPKPANSPEWVEIRERTRDLLAQSKDLRVLPLYAAALLRTDGPYVFCQVVTVAAAWLDDYWESVYPLATDDTIERQGALSCFADQFGIVDALRRMPLVSSRQHGRFSLRDIESAVARNAGESTAAQKAVEAAFDEVRVSDLVADRAHVNDAIQALKRMDARIRASDPEPALSFELLSGLLVKLDRVLRAQLARRPESGVTDTLGGDSTSPGEPASDEGLAPGTSEGGATGPIRSRQDAIRVLEAVATFFEQTEPSSPVPLLLNRAKRLVSKSFMEVLADIAPGALSEARTASGVKSE